MARKPKGPDGPYALDLDRGPSADTAVKEAQILDEIDSVARAGDRAGLRDLDSMTEGMTGLNRMQRDRARLTPRDTVADLGHPRMERVLRPPAEPRQPLSARQRNARSRNRFHTQDTMPLTQLRAQKALVTEPGTWARINDALSEATGDVEALPDKDQEFTRRVDRSIQSYERRNDRGHVVYANVRLPHYINRSNRAGFLANTLAVGDTVALDRYTVGSHQLHETAAHLADTGNTVVLEIQTRRGAYLGHSARKDATAHLLPRGLHLQIAGVHEVTYTDRAGGRGTRTVIQLRDITPEPAKGRP